MGWVGEEVCVKQMRKIINNAKLTENGKSILKV